MYLSLDQAVKRLEAGEVVAIPTETVYGLAACFDNLKAIENIYKLKNRPKDNPLIVHICSMDQLEQLVNLSDFNDTRIKELQVLIQTFWPGPLTLVLPVRKNKVLDCVTAGLETVALRMPANEMTLKLINLTGPLVAPSANISGMPSSTSPDHIHHDFGINFPLIDGGICEKGIESTILMAPKNGESWKVLRKGSISIDSLSSFINVELYKKEKESKPLCPGMSYKHYAPNCRLLLNFEEIQKTNTVLGFDDKSYSNFQKVYSLGSLKDPKKVMKNLYAVLRQLDVDGVEVCSVDMDFPLDGDWEVIFERLNRAAGR